jgi:hypothetical protein
MSCRPLERKRILITCHYDSDRFGTYWEIARAFVLTENEAQMRCPFLISVFVCECVNECECVSVFVCV